MKLYIDMTNLMHVDFLSGMQRVVREVVTRLLEKNSIETVLMAYEESAQRFTLLDAEAFHAFFRGEKTGGKEAIFTEESISFEEFEPGSVLFELDSVWNCPLKRLALYPHLKARGVKIVVFYQDIIPVLFPEYAADATVGNFLGFLVAAMTYADAFLSSTRTNIEHLKEFMQKTGVQRDVPMFVTWLGMDFSQTDLREGDEGVSKTVQKLCEGEKTLLMVGTLEPRKNHQLALDIMDGGLFEKGWRLVIAGRLGWNVEELKKRIETHPMYGKQLFWLQKASDSDIKALYAHSRFVLFPSFAEGFGLPIVEAFQNGAPVLCGDYPVMREVGGRWCRYFSPKDADGLARLVEEENEPEAYDAAKKALESYPFVTWEQVADKVEEALLEVTKPRLSKERMEEIQQASLALKQMVILSARAEDFLRSVPFVEHFMPFIREIVLCCPDHMQSQVEEAYKGRLAIRYLTDTMALCGEELPGDHAVRNIFLRSRAIANDIIDSVFLMGDDDYRPLGEIPLETYVSQGKHIAYYVGDLRRWKSTQGAKTSFDISMEKCRDFLCGEGLPTFMFDAHMPQVICKDIWLESIEEYPQIVEGAASEWSGYFNYALAKYPWLLDLKPYVTMDWPGFLQDWEVEADRSRYLFENFYDAVYEPDVFYGGNGHFLGFSKEFTKDTEQENEQKTRICLEEERRHGQMKQCFLDWQQQYLKTHGMLPVFAVVRQQDKTALQVPGEMPMLAGEFLRYEFLVWNETDSRTQKEWQLTWCVYQNGEPKAPLGSARFDSNDKALQALVQAPGEAGCYEIEWNLFAGTEHVMGQTKLVVESTGRK